jgi:hypothetical protein
MGGGGTADGQNAWAETGDMKELVRQVAEELGYPDPTAVHTGSSTVFRAGDVAIRVTDGGRNPATLSDTDIVAASRALNAAGCGVTQAVFDEARAAGDLSLTFWWWRDDLVELQADPVSWRSLGDSLRRFHGADTGLTLGRLGDLLVTRLETRLRVLRETRPTWMSVSDLARLHDRTAELLPDIPEAAAGADTVHGDFHHGNVLWTADGLVISDLEGLAAGAGAYDLAVLTERVRCYGLDGSLVDALVDGYGKDLRAGPGFEVLVRAKQMISTQWCVVQSLRLPELEDEARKRFDWWREENGPAWHTNPGGKH